MRFNIKSVYALAIVAVVVLAQSAFAQRGRDDAGKAGWLGVSIQDVTEDLRDALPRNIDDGALINHVVPGSPADDAGLKEGDVVVSVDREAVSDSDDLTRIIREAGDGARVRVEYYRDGRSKSTTVDLGSMGNDNARKAKRRFGRNLRRNRNRFEMPHLNDLKFFDTDKWSEKFPMVFGSAKPRLGVRMMDMGDQLAGYFKVTDSKGALVTEVVEDSPAETAGIKAGDVITRVGERDVKDANALRKAMRNLDEGGDVKVEVVRNGRSQTLVVALEEIERPGYHSFMMPGTGVAPFPGRGLGADEWRTEMKEMRQELKELRKALKDLESDLR